MHKTKLVHKISKILVDFLFYTGIITTVSIPFLKGYINWFYGYDNSLKNPMIYTLFFSGICAVYLLFNLKSMFKSLLNGDPFVEKNVSHFRKMATTSMIIALIYIVKNIFLFTITTLIIVFIFIIVSLFCLTLKDLFKQAVTYKEENDLTI